MKIIDKYKKRKNSYLNEIESLKEELLTCYRKLEEKDQSIIELYQLRNEKEIKIKELLDENKDLREKKIKKGVKKNASRSSKSC